MSDAKSYLSSERKDDPVRQHNVDNNSTVQNCFLFRVRHYQNWRKFPALELIQSKNLTLYFSNLLQPMTQHVLKQQN